MLTRIHIRSYKSIKNVDIRLSNLSVLFGPKDAPRFSWTLA
jgi:predicted ATPase